MPAAEVMQEYLDAARTETFRRAGETVEIRRANVYRVRDREIAEIWIFEGDQYAVDELFAGA